jgi:hypothetical protein
MTVFDHGLTTRVVVRVHLGRPTVMWMMTS